MMTTMINDGERFTEEEKARIRTEAIDLFHAMSFFLRVQYAP